MRAPVIAIIGRPNVGKSTLVNRIVGARRAIVDDLPGVTRDRAYYTAEWLDRHFTLVDTGGLVPGEEEPLIEKVNQQVTVALEEADVIIMVVDGQAGVTPIDLSVAKLIRRLKKPVFVAVNKIDSREHLGHVPEFYELGLATDPMPVSAMHGTVGVGDLLDKVMEAVEQLDKAEITTEAMEKELIRIAFVGRPNVGKSSIVNRLLGEERHIVSDIPGTTRDAIDTEIVREEKSYILVDTAGIRKKSKVSYGVEMFSVDRAIRSLRRADITALVIDATEGVTDQDKRIVETSNQAGKGLLLLVNKWDLVPDKTTRSTHTVEKQIYSELPHARFAPILFISAKTGQRLDKIFDWASRIQENRQRRIRTSLVNQLILDAYTLSPPHPVKNRVLKIYYATQVDVTPPTFLLFINSDKLLKEAYRRYLEHRLRESIELQGTPIVLAARSKSEKDTRL